MGDLIEETGDLLIMMEQMRGYLGPELVDRSVGVKLDRELRRIEEGRNEAEMEQETLFEIGNGDCEACWNEMMKK